MHKAEFWELNFAEFQRCVTGYERRLKSEAHNIDRLNHILGRYIIKAIHDPKKYPREPELTTAERRQENVATTDEERIARVKRLYGK